MQRCKVNDGPLPIRTPYESLAANVNVVTQPTQECRHDDDEIAASTLLVLSSSPGRPPGSSPATPFHSMVDSIVARANHQETSSTSTSIIEERVINSLYTLGLRSKRVLPAIGNAPSLLFGSQVSPVMKRPRLDRQYLDPCHRIIFGEVEEVEVEVQSNTVTIPVATVTSNFERFNDNDRITSKNPDRIIMALRKLPIPVYPAKRLVPNPLISVQSSSLPLKQDMTKQSCASLVKRIRNPLGVRSSAPPRDDTLNNRQRSMLAAASHSDWTVPERLHAVSSFCMRTLLLEDVWCLAPGTAANNFSRLSGGPSRNPRFDEQ